MCNWARFLGKIRQPLPIAHHKAAYIFLVLRDVRLHVLRLDDIETDLICDAALVAGDRGSAMYEFALCSEGRRLLSGRATVVFDANKRLKNE